MATLTTVPVQAPASPRRVRNTLELLSLGRAVLIALTALLLAAVLWGTMIHRHSMQKIGKDTAPSIIAAQQIKAAVADMDANAADDLLNPGSTRFAGKFDEERVTASEALIVAAKNITYEAEQAPIETLQVSISNYERLIQEARDLQDEGRELPDDGGKEKQAMAVRYYRAAAIVMDGTILPAADDLDKANNDELEREYLDQSTWSLVTRLLVLLLGIALLAGLVYAQMQLSRRTRRTLNPGLAGASVVTLLLTLLAFGSMAREQSDLHAAKEDAFASVHALLQARAVGYAANSEESRYLLDQSHAGEYEAEFKQNTDKLIHFPASLDRSQLLAQLRSDQKPADFAGFLADELNNITYKGEKDAAIDSVDNFEKYMALDQNLRVLGRASQNPSLSSEERANKLRDAISLDVGDSDYAFSQFDLALQRTLDINQKEFLRAVDSGFGALAHLEWEACFGALLAALLIFFGFAPRIREYQ